MNDRSYRGDAAWFVLWNIGLLVGFIGLPAVLGFFAGRSLEAHGPALPWRIFFVVLGVVVGAFAAWRTLMPATRRRE